VPGGLEAQERVVGIFETERLTVPLEMGGTDRELR